jgi:hypothetical protein
MEEINNYVRSPIDPGSLNNDLIFQVISWYGRDGEGPEANEDTCDDANQSEYEIFAHGVNRDGQSVCLKILKFISYFYIKIPDRYQKIWGYEQTNTLFRYLKGVQGW